MNYNLSISDKAKQSSLIITYFETNFKPQIKRMDIFYKKIKNILNSENCHFWQVVFLNEIALFDEFKIPRIFNFWPINEHFLNCKLHIIEIALGDDQSKDESIHILTLFCQL